ncbi:dTDP-4-dehydrorhamnose reductase [bacterium]|nr:MAG: dTDP-4-dehydrorhamnose reductase [bacterium]
MVEKIKKRVLITGSRGILGRALVERLKAKYKIAALTHKNCDITDSKKVAAIFARFKPEIVIHSAACTDVDECQRDPRKAYAVNAQGAVNIAKSCASLGAILIYISTDYVFSGKKKTPYRETDATGPLSIYAKSKLMAEKSVRRLVKRHIIVRTSWIFGKGRKGFLNNVLSWAKSKKRLKIVSDKYSSPTSADDLAAALDRIIIRMGGNGWKDRFFGTYHITSSGFCSWYGWARYALKNVKAKVRLEPIGMAQMGFAARRPPFSALDNSKYKKTFGIGLRPWQKAVKEYIKCVCN